MKFKVKIAVGLLYVSGFSSFLIDLLGLDKNLSSIVLLVLDLGVIMLSMGTIRKNNFNFISLISIIFISLLNFSFHSYSFLSYINGLRELINVVLIFSFFDSLANSASGPLFHKRFIVFARIFLIVQVPISIYQFILHGASDAVGGSLGVGFSGVLTLTTIILVYTMIKERKVMLGIKAYYYALFLLPLFLNETKVSFILIPVMFLCLTDTKRKGQAIWSIAIGGLIFFGLNSLYTDQGKKSSNPLKELFSQDFLENYLYSDVELGADVPRFTKIVLAGDLLNKSSINFLFGVETGAFKGGTLVKPTTFAKDYEWLLLGSRPYLFFLLISGGWTLSITLIFFILQKLFQKRTHLKSDKPFISLLTVIFVTVLFYNDAFRNQFFVLIFSYCVLYAKGYFHNNLSSLSQHIATKILCV